MRIGIQLDSLRLPLDKALPMAAKLGAQGVELNVRRELPREMSDTAVRHFRKKLEDCGLRLAAAAFPTRRGYEVREDLDRRIAATRDAMRLAYRLGANVLLNHIGRIGDEEDPSFACLVEALTDLGRFAQHSGVWLAATTGAESGADLQRLFAALPEGSLTLNFDPGQLLINSHSPREVVQQLGQHIQHVRATDGVRDLAKGRGIETQLGRGAADFPELVALLEEHQYRGFYTIQRQSPDPIPEIEQSVSFLKSLGP